MTTSQLCIAIAVPVVVNGLMLTGLMLYIGGLVEDLKNWVRADLDRFDETLDTWLKHLEGR